MFHFLTFGSKVIANHYETPYPRRFNSPNDVVVHPVHPGRIFFTDPTYGLIEKERNYDGIYVNEKRDLEFNGVYEIKDYMENKFVNLVDHELFRPNGITISPDGTMLYVSESCTGNFESSCSQGKIKFHQYTIALNETMDMPQKIGSFTFDVEGVGASDGFKIHPSTGLIVSSCPSGLCIIKPMTFQNHGPQEKVEGGELIAHVKLGDKPTKVSNVAFGEKYMYITGDGRIWRIKLSKSHMNQNIHRKNTEL